MINEIYAKYHGIEDEQWLSILLDSIHKNKIDGIEFPGFPDEQTQINFVGSANENTIQEIWPYYRTVRKIAQENGVLFDENTRLLDVGSGWGRVIRFFLKDIHPDNLYGMDTMQSSVDLCNDFFNNILNFRNITTMPPTDFNDAWFDLIEGYSVVSHLSRHSGLMWLDEYYRLLKPGGIIALTVWKCTHFNYITEWQRTIQKSEGYQSLISQIYTPECVIEKKIFNTLGFDYKSYGGGGIEGNEEITYGEAIMSQDYIKKYWCRHFDFISYVDAPELAQALVVLQKPIKNELSSCVDEIRQEQYDMLKQMDRMNGITFEIATGFQNVLDKNKTLKTDMGNENDNIQFTPAVGYKKLTVNHARAAIRAFRNGLSRKIGSNSYLSKMKNLFHQKKEEK
jgi:SAM-dependent methyltransferase